MGDPIFGVAPRRVDEEARPVIAADLSTIGIIGPMPQADLTIFPLDTPVRVDSNRLSLLKAMVKNLAAGTEGFVPDAIRGINDQLGATQFAARCVVVNTAVGISVDPVIKAQQTINNIVGSSTAATGLWAFLKSPHALGVTPRLIVAPGYTGQMANGINEVVQVDAGAGYVQDQSYPITFTLGGADAIQATAHAFGQADGTLGPVILDTPGAWYTSVPTVTAPVPAGVGGAAATYTATIIAGANPIVASLTGVLNQLMGHAVVESSGQSQVNDDDWRETISSERIIPISGGCRVIDPVSSDIVFRPLSPRVVGIGVRRDHEKGAPFHSWANQAVQGIIGPNRDIPFALTDDANEAQELLRDNIGVLVRGEIGNEFAIASGGFIFIGTDNAGEDELWRFYNMTRGRDFIILTLLRAMRFYLGRYNIVPHTVQAILNAMKGVLRDLKADGHILGYRIMFNPSSNSADQIRLGNLTVGFKAEEPAPLRKLVIEHARYREAVDAMIADLATQLNLAA